MKLKCASYFAVTREKKTREHPRPRTPDIPLINSAHIIQQSLCSKSTHKPTHPPPTPLPEPTMSQPPILRPIARRPYDLPDDVDSDADRPPQRSKSTVSLTAGALFGIYGQTLDDSASAAGTPALTRNNSAANFADLKMTPARARGRAAPAPPRPPRRTTATGASMHIALRVASLFVFGVAYGVVVTHLHARGGWGGARWDAYRALAWGGAGVVLGSVLPWLDGQDGAAVGAAVGAAASGGWSPVVRSIGAFVGIAYAIVSGRVRPPPRPANSLTPCVEKAAVAVDAAGVARARAREPVPLVPDRPHALGLLVCVARRRRRNRVPAPGQPQRHPGARRRGRDGRSGGRVGADRDCGAGHVDCQRAVLLVCVLWKRGPQVGPTVKGLLSGPREERGVGKCTLYHGCRLTADAGV